MEGREFLSLGEEFAAGSTEVEWRCAAGRIYYGLMLEGRDALERWGFLCPPRDNIHAFVRLRFSFAADRDLKYIGDCLDRLGRLRNHADYRTRRVDPFDSDAEVIQALIMARDALVRLDNINSNATRKASAIASIRAAWP